MSFAPSKSRESAKILIMDLSKTSDHIQINAKIRNQSQDIWSSAPDQRPEAEIKTGISQIHIYVELFLIQNS